MDFYTLLNKFEKWVKAEGFEIGPMGKIVEKGAVQPQTTQTTPTPASNTNDDDGYLPF